MDKRVIGTERVYSNQFSANSRNDGIIFLWNEKSRFAERLYCMEENGELVFYKISVILVMYVLYFTKNINMIKKAKFRLWKVLLTVNIIFFREYIKTVENYEQKLSFFKNNLMNQVAKLREEEECEKADFSVPYEEWTDEEREEFEDKWSYTSPVHVLDLFNEMGWDYNEISRKKIVCQSILGSCAYIPYGFIDVWEKIIECNVIDFCYAMLVFSNSISKDKYLLKCIEGSVNCALKKYELSELKGLLLREALPTVFVAMSFSKEMRNAKDMIEKVIKDAGYKPSIIDDKQYNGFVVPEIFFEIEKSEFVIADFTEQKNGVYYEAGYAKALKKEIIMTCKEDDFSKTHFDTKQMNHILWEDENDLYKKLIDRIEATIGLRI